MYETKKTKLMWLYGLTSAHVGSGDNLSYVDSPIQREKHTDFPKIEASSLKGSIRHHVRKKTDEKTADSIFGKGNGEEDSSASEVAISDTRILFFPVKSAKGIFAWVTCPMVIERFIKDCKLVKEPDVLTADCGKDAICAAGDALKISGNKIMLEELVFQSDDPDKEKKLEGWINKLIETFPLPTEFPKEFTSRVVVIPNDDFKYFVSQSTEVITRVRIDSNTGTAVDGGLFTEEYLPPESLMYSLVFLKKEVTEVVKTNLKSNLDENIVQIGGNATLGKGLFSVKLVEGVEKS